MVGEPDLAVSPIFRRTSEAKFSRPARSTLDARIAALARRLKYGQTKRFALPRRLIELPVPIDLSLHSKKVFLRIGIATEEHGDVEEIGHGNSSNGSAGFRLSAFSGMVTCLHQGLSSHPMDVSSSESAVDK